MGRTGAAEREEGGPAGFLAGFSLPRRGEDPGREGAGGPISGFDIKCVSWSTSKSKCWRVVLTGFNEFGNHKHKVVFKLGDQLMERDGEERRHSPGPEACGRWGDRRAVWASALRRTGTGAELPEDEVHQGDAGVRLRASHITDPESRHTGTVTDGEGSPGR